jgi:hypothetical protein
VYAAIPWQLAVMHCAEQSLRMWTMIVHESQFVSEVDCVLLSNIRSISGAFDDVLLRNILFTLAAPCNVLLSNIPFICESVLLSNLSP